MPNWVTKKGQAAAKMIVLNIIKILMPRLSRQQIYPQKTSLSHIPSKLLTSLPMESLSRVNLTLEIFTTANSQKIMTITLSCIWVVMAYPTPSSVITILGSISVWKGLKVMKIIHLALGIWVFKVNFIVWDSGLFIAFILTAWSGNGAQDRLDGTWMIKGKIFLLLGHIIFLIITQIPTHFILHGPTRTVLKSH